MKLPTCIYVWDGHNMIPTLHFARLAESSFTSGEAYRLMVMEEKERERAQRRRTREQNNMMWALLTEISNQIEHCGRRYTPDQWKVLLMHANGQEVKFLPALDGKTFVPYGGRSSHMTVNQMSELIEFIRWWGNHNGVQFADMEGVTWQR